MTVNPDDENSKDASGRVLIGKSKKVSVEKDFRKQFASTFTAKFSPNGDSPSLGRVNPNLDDRTKMPANTRRAGFLMEMKLPEGLDQNFEVGDTKIQYLLRVSIPLYSTYGIFQSVSYLNCIQNCCCGLSHINFRPTPEWKEDSDAT
ncbi:unnamed protein product [Dibothriocephalus latus]|uniref:Uncharacterized protein n=1 Tax=Dibothriocephalus latus TaxID=60516 RepID=A0A3P6SM54_DIBLA|nr:unnamed protein product [Dibothriocephalus latus]